jgi:hypothetical protein
MQSANEFVRRGLSRSLKLVATDRFRHARDWRRAASVLREEFRERIDMPRCAFLLFVSFLPLAAQNASITGTVSDPQQAPIPNVSVTLTNIDMGIAVRANTDVEGNYEFEFVRPGNYIIKVEHPGFRAPS